MMPSKPVTYTQAPGVDNTDLQRRLKDTYRMILRAANRTDTTTAEAPTNNDHQKLSA